MTDRRVVSVWLPTLPTDRLCRRWTAEARRLGATPDSDWWAEPLVTTARARGGLGLAAVNAAARAAGLRPGQPLAEARALVPGLRAVPAEPEADARAARALADWCGLYTPWTAVDAGPGRGAGLWLDISGCAHLLGGEDTLLADLTQRLAGFGYACRAGLADTPGAAWAAARFLTTAAAPWARLAPGDLQAPLAPLPAAALRLAPETLDGLRRMGLRSVGDLVATPRGPLVRRFGEAVTERLDQAFGATAEPLSPRRPPPALRVRLPFAEPMGDRADLGRAVRHLLDEMCTGLGEAGLGARRLDLAAYRVDGTVRGLAVGTGRPMRDADHLERLFRDKLDRLDAGFGIEVLTLAATRADPLAAAQGELESRHAAAGRRDVGRLLDRLSNRLGFRRVVRLAEKASHVPERACAEAPAAAPAPPTDPAPDRPRPLHLLPWPEPVEAVAPVPDDPPVMFRWRRRQYRVRRAEGPERVGGEWWLEAPAIPRDDIRDYYRVEDGEGRRFWLYREGLYRPGVRPRWFLHGFFA